MSFDDLFAECEAETGAFVTVFGVEPRKGVEDPVGIDGVETDAVVDHAELHKTAGEAGDDDGDLRRNIGSDKFEGVVDKVVKELINEYRESVYGRQIVSVDLCILLQDEHLEVFLDLTKDRVDIGYGGVFGGSVEGREVEDAFDHGRHPACGILDLVQVDEGLGTQKLAYFIGDAARKNFYFPDRFFEVMTYDMGELEKIVVAALQFHRALSDEAGESFLGLLQPGVGHLLFGDVLEGPVKTPGDLVVIEPDAAFCTDDAFFACEFAGDGVLDIEVPAGCVLQGVFDGAGDATAVGGEHGPDSKREIDLVSPGESEPAFEPVIGGEPAGNGVIVPGAEFGGFDGEAELLFGFLQPLVLKLFFGVLDTNDEDPAFGACPVDDGSMVILPPGNFLPAVAVKQYLLLPSVAWRLLFAGREAQRREIVMTGAEDRAVRIVVQPDTVGSPTDQHW